MHYEPVLRVRFMIKVSLFYKDSSTKGEITDWGAHKNVSQTFGPIYWLYAVRSRIHFSLKLRQRRGSGNESSRAHTLNSLGRGQSWPTQALLCLRTPCRVHDILHRFPEWELQPDLMAFWMEPFSNQSVKCFCCALLSHKLKAQSLERQGGVCVCAHVRVVWWRAAWKCSGLVLSSAVPTGIRKGHMQNHTPHGL